MALSYTARKRGRLFPKNLPYNSIYAESATQEFALGTELLLDDGRMFRYAENGAAAIGKGKMAQAVAPTANHTNIALGGTAAAGATTVAIATTLSTAMVQNEYADGWLLVNDATGEGQCYQIKGNDAGTTGNIYLWDGLVTALDATSEFTLVRNKCKDVIVQPTTVTGAPAGVPLIDLTADYFGWLQVRGPAPLLVDAGDTVVIGDPIGQPATHGTAGAGGLVDASAATAMVWGTVLVVNAATEYCLVDLKLQ